MLISPLSQTMTKTPTPDSLRSGSDLAHFFGWSDDDLQPRDLSRGETHLKVARASVSGQPAALFASVAFRNGFDPLDIAALYAYHSTVDWGLLADQRGLTVFNSHWLSDTRWYQLPVIPWEDAAGQSSILESLTPRSLVSGDTERLISMQKQPTGFLQPVDDGLVERLDGWRDQALRYARDGSQVDHRLQTLYAQLFVLRTVEDRKLDSSVPALSSVAKNSQHIDWANWTKLIGAAREHIGSDLFNNEVAREIPEHVFAGVIHDLYYPKGLPASDARYDFSWIEADVLGLAYEKYLATVLQPAPPAAQRELFLSPEREVERLSVRKKSGVYYTPKFITGLLATRCIDDFFANWDGETLPRVIDFACGSGSFLVAAIDQILKHLKRQQPDRHWVREIIDGGFIAGIDVDPNAVTTARHHLWQRLVQEPHALPLPDLEHVVIVADGLDRKTWGKLDVPYDIVLGNPPFLATSMVLRRDELESLFDTAKGRFDFSYLFVEQALRVLNSNGRMGMVVPNRLFRNRNGQILREMLANKCKIQMLVDFGSTRPFDASAYVGCLIASLRKVEDIAPKYVRVIEVRSLTPEFMTALLLEAGMSQVDISNDIIKAFLARHPSSGNSWVLISESDKHSLVMFEDISVRLGTIAATWQGIRTGANDLFIFEIESSDGAHLCKAINGLGESAVIEIELLEPVVYGTEVQRYQIVSPTKRLLYPYRNGHALAEGELEKKFPNTWSYLLRNRDLLAGRSSMQQTGGKWFELVRPRAEGWLRHPKLLIRDLAPRTAFALDEFGKTFLAGGSAVVPQDQELLLPLLAYLNSDAINALVRRTTPQFRGEFQKFEPQHLQAIPVLRQLIEDENFNERLSDLALRVVAARVRENEGEAVFHESEIDGMIKDAVRARGIAVDQ